MNRTKMLFPLLAGFFVMGFGDIIGTVMNQVRAECSAHADALSLLMPIFAYVWFLVISIPAGVMAGRIGRRNAVLVSLAVTAVAMAVPLFASAGRWYLYVAAFALLGIGNTIIQASLPALMSNVVEPSQLASRISLGQFVKAVCAALTPVLVYLAATKLGNWKLVFPLYGLVAVCAALWLQFSGMPDERQVTEAADGVRRTTFCGCFAMLGEPYVLAMTLGILFSVGADVGFSVAVPEYLKNVFKVDRDLAGVGPTVYFVAKTAAAFAGAVVFAKVSAARCFPWCMGLGLAATAAVPFVSTPAAFLAIVAFVALMTANSFGMCMGLAIGRFPSRANEISALMVMAIVGGGVVSSALGLMQASFGPSGIVVTLGVCIAYLFALGLFVSGKVRRPVRAALAGVFLLASAGFSRPALASPSGFVDPKIGGSYNGHTFPGATCPFGLVQAGPDTGHCDWAHCSGYVWEDPHVYGFTQTHLSGTGCPELEDVRLLPFSDAFDGAHPSMWRLAKDFRSEIASPGYYSVSFPMEGIRVEASATHRTAIYRMTYGKGRSARMLVDFQWINGGDPTRNVLRCSSVLSGDRLSISGGRDTRAWLTRHVSWKVVFDRPWISAEKLASADPEERGARYVLDFGEVEGPVVARVSISTVDERGADMNYEAESRGRTFDEIRNAARAEWDALLSRFEVPGASPDQITAFYTSVYHLFTQPNDIADVDGRYRGGDGKVARSPGGRYYSGLSLWDTFRAAHPLYTIAAPEICDDVIRSMLAHYKAVGFLPVIPYFGCESYCMIGNHSVPVVVDAYLKGFRGFDAELAFEAVTNSLTVQHFGPDGSPKCKEDWAVYDTYGYYPFDLVKTESVSRTLECGYDDWCAAEFCKALAKGDESFFRRRSEGWRKVFDPQSGFMRGKDSKGAWRSPFCPFALGHDSQDSCDFTEGNSFQYTWHVLQDPAGLIAAFGGGERFAGMLDSLFRQPERVEGMGRVQDVTGLIGQYAHGNEPSHHVAYLYTLAGRPDRAAEVVRDVMERFYLRWTIRHEEIVRGGVLEFEMTDKR